MNKKLGAEDAPDFGSLFDNLDDEKKTVDEKKLNFNFNVSDCDFDKLTSFLVLLQHDYFSEVEAAMFLRLPDPEGQGKDTIRNYAIRSKRLSFYKIGRTGLIFSRKDLEKFLETQKSKSLEDSFY